MPRKSQTVFGLPIVPILLIGVVILAISGGTYYYLTQSVTTTTMPFIIVGTVDHFDASQSGYLTIYVNVGGGLAPVQAQYSTIIVTSGYGSMYCVGLQHVGPSSQVAKVCLGDYVIVNVTHTVASDVMISIIDTTTNTRTP